MHRSRLPPVAVILRRLLTAVLLAALVVTVASAALFVTTAPAPISLLVEPFSLLLMPGLLMAVAVTGTHADVSTFTVLAGSAAFYFVFIAAALWQLRTPAHPRSR